VICWYELSINIVRNKDEIQKKFSTQLVTPSFFLSNLLFEEISSFSSFAISTNRLVIGEMIKEKQGVNLDYA